MPYGYLSSYLYSILLTEVGSAYFILIVNLYACKCLDTQVRNLRWHNNNNNKTIV